MEKNDFLKIINSLSIKEINKIISEKGKPPKLIMPIVFIKK